jgi:hypothetical protein
MLINEDGETIGRASGSFSPKEQQRGYGNRYDYRFDYNFSHRDTTVTFQNVDSNKITDTLTVSITGVNDMDAKTAGERGYMSISTEDFAAMEDQFRVQIRRFGSIEITGYKGASKTVVIPEKLGRWPVTSIGERAFYYNNLTSVVIPNGVTYIGKEAFSGNRLTSVVIPNSVTFIGFEAFADNQLTSVTLPANVDLKWSGSLPSALAIPCAGAYNANGKKAGTYTWTDGRGWTYRPNGVTSTGDGAFSGNKLTVIPNGVTSIGNHAFASKSLTSIVIPDSVTSIGDMAFVNNKLTSVVIPNSVTSIGNMAFAGNNLTSVVIPNGVTSIGNMAFADNNLTSVVIGNGVTSIGEGAFAHNQLTSVVIPNSVTSIGEKAFADNKLTSVVIPNSVTSIGKGAFAGNRPTSVTLPANVNLDRSDLPCATAYKANGKKAGTYTRTNADSRKWTYRP